MNFEKQVFKKLGYRKIIGPFCITFILIVLVTLWMVEGSSSQKPKNDDNKPQAAASPHPVKEIEIDLDKGMAVKIPAIAKDLQVVSFNTPDSKQGWAIRIPGSFPIATPAYADGLIFVGGGYGSHEFYALDAESGRVVWKMQTKDDGPTAAVVEDGYVAFNTESCTVMVAEAKTGKIIWEQWLGDPLMSQPAISKGRLYMAYPGGQRGSKPGHRMLCADLKTGRHIWEKEITGDVISAPVVSGDQLLFTCFDGTSFSLNASTGVILWKKQNAGTSAPLVAGGMVVTTSKNRKAGKTYEGLQRLELEKGGEHDQELLAKEEAGYLDENQGGGSALSAHEAKSLDSSVGFSSAPATAKLDEANKHLGVSTVAGAWAYQGSRAAYQNGLMINAQGLYLNSINSSNGRFAWRARMKGEGINEGTQVFSPPSLGLQNIYLCSSQGHIVSVHQQNGGTVFLYALKQPMVFQPALARGNLYAGTANGMVICLKTGNKDADGWYAWGGNAQHNKK